MLKRLIGGLSILLCILMLGMPAQAIEISQVTRFCSYEIDVELNPQTKQVMGGQTVIWTNQGKEVVKEMYFYLYPNAFKQDSTFMLESHGSLRGDKIKSEGFMDITDLKVNGQEQDFSYVHPDDGNTLDQTVGRITLASPVKPGESVTLDFEFIVQLPEVFARMGYHNDFFMVAQWYPKIAAYELAGVRGRQDEGWNVHQYHGNSEFYGNFSNFKVSITVPKEYTVAACGALEDKQLLSDTVRYTYLATPVHTFSWMADTGVAYEQREMTFGAQPVNVHVYLQKKNSKYLDEYFDVIVKTMQYYHEWLGDYPYSELTVIEPEVGASGAAGMEYPTLVLGADASVTPLKGYALNTLVHELGHQYFYGLVASNEKEEPWLDEGLTSYIETKAMQDVFGSEEFAGYWAEMVPQPYPLDLAAWEYQGGHTYGSNVYTRAQLVLLELEERIGSGLMKRFLYTYVENYRFGHPNTENVLETLEAVTNSDFTSFFESYIYGAEMQDIRVESFNCELLTDGDKQGQYYTSLDVIQPDINRRQLKLTLELSNGKQIYQTYVSSASPQFIGFTTSEKVVGVCVDPAVNKIYLDNNLMNNGLRKASSLIPASWTSILIQLIVGWLNG